MNDQLEGTLLIREDHLFLCVDSPTLPPPIPIKPGEKLEVHLGAYWIEGEFRPGFDETGKQVEPYDLACGPSFCGLRSGMRARLCDNAPKRRQDMDEDIRQALLRLTALRKRVLKANDLTGQLFASLIDQTEPQPSQSDLEQAIKDLEQKVTGYYVWYEPRHARYALIPKTDQEL